MAIVNAQTLEGVIQFDGQPNRGRWDFAHYRHLHRTVDIQIDTVSYAEDPNGGAPVTTAIGFIAFRSGNTVLTDRVVFARDSAMFGDLINPVTGNAAKAFPGIRLPREPGDNGEWWNILLFTGDKTQRASAIVTWYLIPNQLDT